MTDKLRIMLIFPLHALMVASLFARLPEIQLRLGLSEAEFGLVLTGIPIGVLIASLLVSQFIAQIGTRNTMAIAAPLFALAPTVAALANDMAHLFAGLMFFGLTLSSLNISMNIEADRIEVHRKIRIMNKCHGSWGLGFLICASLSAGAIRIGVTPLQHFLLLILVVGVASAVLIWPMSEAPPRHHAGQSKPARFAIPNAGSFLIVAYALAGIWVEGTVRNWGIIYLRDGYGALEWQAALALPAMMLTQTIGRFAADGWVTRYGDVSVARALGVVVLLGVTVLAVSQSTGLALIGFALIGLGLSTIFPQSISAAARWGDRPAGTNVAAFSTLQTLLSFITPVAVGFVAELIGLRATWLLFLPLIALSLYLARILKPRPI